MDTPKPPDWCTLQTVPSLNVSSYYTVTSNKRQFTQTPRTLKPEKAGKAQRLILPVAVSEEAQAAWLVPAAPQPSPRRWPPFRPSSHPSFYPGGLPAVERLRSARRPAPPVGVAGES